MASYVDQVLISGETVVYRGALSKWGDWHLWLFGVLLAPVLVGFILLAIAYIRLISTEIAITNKRVIAKFGLIKRTTTEIQLTKIESIQVDQSVMGRMLDFGTVMIHGTGSGFAPIANIAAPLVFRNKFVEATDVSQRAG